jgi:tetratricopeptide (TPR) repeat protein
MFVALAELLELRPRDKELMRDYREVRRGLGFVDEKTGEADTLSAIEAEEEDIDLLLARVDLYVNQGLVRNARRILENLNIRFPRSPKIEEKIARLEEVKPEIPAEEIQGAVGKVQDIEAKIEAAPEPAKPFLSGLRGQGGTEKLITSADLFADTEILPLPTEKKEEIKYHDLGRKIRDARDAAEHPGPAAARGYLHPGERPDRDRRRIREQVRRKVDTKDYETRFQPRPGLLGQGLLEEAIEEFLLASEDPARALECYSIICKAYKLKKNNDEALYWLEKSLGLAEVGSSGHFALLYELAAFHEDTGDRQKALELYRRIKGWNPAFRDVTKKVESLSS